MSGTGESHDAEDEHTGLCSEYEQETSDADRPARGERPRWGEDVSSDQPDGGQAADVQRAEGGELGGREDDSEAVDRLVPLIAARLEQHLHLPVQPPDPDVLAELKRKDPRAHKMWLKQVAREMGHQRFMREAQYRMPLTVIRWSQIVCLLALVTILAVAGYALYLGHAVTAGVIVTIDVIGILSVFTDIGRQKDNQDETGISDGE